MITDNPGGDMDFSPAFFTGGTSTAGNATITNSGIVNFYQGSSAGSATITTNAGGTTSFFGESTGGNAAGGDWNCRKCSRSRTVWAY